MSRQVDVKALISHIVKGDGQDKCRICMGETTDGQVYLGDTVMLDGDRSITLAELLETITGVEMPLEADLPPGLCSDCFTSLNAAATFRSLCHQSSNRWYKIIDLLHELPNTEVSHLDCLYAVIEEDKLYLMENEPKPVKMEFDMSGIEDFNTENDVYVVKKKRKRTFPLAKKTCSCPDCGKPFSGPHLLYEHFLESTNDKRACFICALIMSREELIVHLKEKHNVKLFVCKKCPALFQTKEKFLEHSSKAHEPGAIYCGDCGSTFSTQQAFNGHCVKHTAKLCPGCDTLFRNRKCYLHHVKRCCNLDKSRKDLHRTKHKVLFEVRNNERKVKVGMRGSSDETCICDYCNKTFAGKKYVRAHIQIVHTKNTHRPCPYCAKSLAAAHMTEHIKKHEKTTRSYTCEHCGVVLNTRLGYVQHIRLHTGEKPYICKFCHESFSASSRRSEHIRKMHKNPEELVLKHKCELCPAKFRLPYRLKKHIETVHTEKQVRGRDFECPECHIKFSSCRGLLYHTKKHQAVKAVMETKSATCEETVDEASVDESSVPTYIIIPNKKNYPTQVVRVD